MVPVFMTSCHVVRIVEGRTAREPHNDDDQGQHNAHGEPTASANCLAK